MRINYIDYEDKFERQFKKLPKIVKDLAEAKEAIFRGNPFDPHLKTHKLHGKDKSAWAFWINRSYRIKFIFLADNGVLLTEIGRHDIYQ